jgi:hypothetical protein
LPFDGRDIENFFQSIENEIFWILLGIFCLVIFLSLLFLALGVLGQGGLIASFGKADEGQIITLSGAFSDGIQLFWKMLGIRILFWLLGMALGAVLVIGVVLIAVFTLGIGLLAILPLLCLLIPLALAIDAYIILTMVAAVEEEAGVFEAFGHSWKVVREQIGPFLIMTLILVIGGAIASVILALPIFIVFGPLVIGFLTGDDQGLYTGLAISGICLLAAIPVLTVLQGILTTFITGSWTLSYRRLTGKEGVEALPEPA